MTPVSLLHFWKGEEVRINAIVYIMRKSVESAYFSNVPQHRGLTGGPNLSAFVLRTDRMENFTT